MRNLPFTAERIGYELDYSEISQVVRNGRICLIPLVGARGFDLPTPRHPRSSWPRRTGRPGRALGRQVGGLSFRLLKLVHLEGTHRLQNHLQAISGPQENDRKQTKRLSGRRDFNPGPLAPQTSVATRSKGLFLCVYGSTV